MNCLLTDVFNMSVIDVVNIGLFIAAFLFAVSNCITAAKSDTHVSKLILMHSALISVISGLYVFLQIEWLVNGHDSFIPGLVVAGWSAFESLTGMALVFYGLAMSTLLKWKHTMHSIDENFTTKPNNTMQRY